MDEPKLKPCPFCTSDDVAITRFTDRYGQSAVAVCCNECDATGPSQGGEGPDVVQWWNERDGEEEA